MVLSGSFGGVGASVLTPGIEDARARSSNMLMKSISGSNGILDKAMPLGRNRTDGTRDSLSRDQIGTAGRDDQVASLEADCRGACTKLKPCRDAAPGYTSALCARDACARDAVPCQLASPVPPPCRAAQATARRSRRSSSSCRPSPRRRSRGETPACCRCRHRRHRPRLRPPRHHASRRPLCHPPRRHRPRLRPRRPYRRHHRPPPPPSPRPPSPTTTLTTARWGS